VALEPRQIDKDAPRGVYQVDAIVEQILSAGCVFDIARIRDEVADAAKSAAEAARVAVERQPRRLRKVRRLFKDLGIIRRVMRPHWVVQV
jgi:hypothetical protein